MGEWRREVAELILNLGVVITGNAAVARERHDADGNVHVIHHDPRIVRRLGHLLPVGGEDGLPVQIGSPPQLNPQDDRRVARHDIRWR